MTGRTSLIERAQYTPTGVEADVIIGGSRHRIAYDISGAQPRNAGDALLTASLLPAMRVSDRLCATEPVSPKLLGALPTIQSIYRSFAQRYAVYDIYKQISVEATARPASTHRGRRGVATFFSGGVDSFYTFFRHADEITALIFIGGFDVPTSGSMLGSRVLPAVRKAALELNRPLVEVRTDLRRFAEQYVHWNAYHGPELASVAQLLSSDFSRVYIPATQTYAHLGPLGSHPVLDPLWSTEDVDLVHDGCEASRLEKIACIASHEAPRKWLRVCLQNHPDAYNCGRCEKCLRTMLSMEALGVLDLFETFPTKMHLPSLTRIDLPSVRYTWDSSVELLAASGRDPVLVRDLRRRLYSRRARVIRRLRHYGRRLREISPRNHGLPPGSLDDGLQAAPPIRTWK